MNKKGFTLVEIMAVLIVMGVLLAVTVPSVFNSIDRKKNKEHDDIVKEIEEAAELYITQNEDVKNFFDSTNNINISYDILVSEELINGNQLDPKTKEKWNRNSYVNVVKDDKKMIPTYKEGSYESTINLSSANVETSTSENYFTNKLLENLIAVDETGRDYTSAVTYSCKINKTGAESKENCKNIKNIPGTHQIIYTLNYNNRTYTSTSDVKVN